MQHPMMRHRTTVHENPLNPPLRKGEGKVGIT